MRDLYEQTPVIDEKIQCALFSCHPTTFDEVVKDAQWVQAMIDEIDVIGKNQTWYLVDIPTEKGELENHKACKL